MEYPKRKNIRLAEYDYSQNGVYFVTICTAKKQRILSNISVGAIINRPPVNTLTEIGTVVDNVINEITMHYPSATVDKYVIMPNHVHILLRIDNDGRLLIAPTISTVVKELKSKVSRTTGASIWQRSFYDHVIRSDEDYLNTWRYIDENPAKWSDDEYYT